MDGKYVINTLFFARGKQYNLVHLCAYLCSLLIAGPVDNVANNLSLRYCKLILQCNDVLIDLAVQRQLHSRISFQTSILLSLIIDKIQDAFALH